MARMFPPVVSPSSPEDERKIFHLFKNAPKTENWVVFHSLGLDYHVDQARGEIDFLVCAPNLGFFALEVKGGTSISRDENGEWHFAYGIKRSPFEQASKGRSSLYESYLKHSSLKNILFEYGVMFPKVIFNNTDPDVCQTIIYDKRDAKDVYRYILRLSHHYQARHRNSGIKMPTKADVDQMITLMRKPFELDKLEPLVTKLITANERALQLTEEQYKIVEGLSFNNRLLILGAAGTGKTLLAKYEAINSIQNGEKVALLCFNILLQNELKKLFSYYIDQKKIVVCSLTEYLTDLAIRYHLIDRDYLNTLSPMEVSNFYNEELPGLVFSYIKADGFQFDKIIIDECQDLIKENYLLIIDEMLKGGLKNGKWSFYGDFDCQNIYNRDMTNEEARKYLLNYSSDFSVFYLSVNCRNTPTIQNEMNKLLKLHSSVLNEEDYYFPAVEKFSYQNTADGVKKLDQLLDKLVNKDHIPKDKITILSPHVRRKSLVAESKFDISDYSGHDSPTGFTTIWKYKGLENDIIIITDITNEETANPQLLYSGMSRARGALYLLKDESGT